MNDQNPATATVAADQPAAAVAVADQPAAEAIVIPDAPTTANLPMVVPQSTTQMKRIVDTIDVLPEHMQQATALAEKFNFEDTNAVLTYGAGAQKKYLEELKELVRNRKVGELHGAANIILSIEKGIDMIGLDQMKKELASGGPDWVGKIFNPVARMFGYAKTAIEAFIAKRQDLFALIDDIEKDTEKTMQLVMTDNARLDVMYGDVETNFYELACYIAAGEMILDRGQAEYEALRQEALDSNDPIKIGEVNRFREQLVAFDTRLLRMKTAYVKAPVTLAKVLTTQQAGRMEIQNLMDSILFDLPSLLETINLLLSLFDIKDAQETCRKREGVNKRLQELEGNLLDEVATAAKEDQARGAKEVAMIEAQTTKLLGTLKRMKEIDEKNSQIRVEAENLLVDVMGSFKKGMVEVTAPDVMPARKSEESNAPRGRDSITIG